MGRADRRKVRKEGPAPTAAARPAPAPWSDTTRLGVLAVASVALLAVPLFGRGPLAFLPAILAWPLVLAGAAGWWLREASRRGWPAPSERAANAALEVSGLVLVFGSFLLLKLVGLHPSGADENIYYYMAERMTHGTLPYRDYFFAHPPVHLLVPAAVFGVTGFSIGVAKSIPALAQALAALFLYLAVRKASRPLALVTLLLHLTSYEVLMGSTDMNGENLMTAFLAAAVLASVRRRPLTAGVLAGLGLGTGLYALAGVLALAVASAFSGRRVLARYGIGLAASFGGACLVFGILGGGGFVEGVFTYHLAKRVKGADRVSLFESANPFVMLSALLSNLAAYLRGKDFAKILYYHAPAYVAGLLAVALLGGRALRAYFAPAADRPGGWKAVLTPGDLLSGTPQGFAKLGVLAVVLFTLQWAALNEVYDFYNVPLLAFLSLPAAWTLVEAHRLLGEASRPAALAVPLALMAGFALNAPLMDSINASLWPEEQATRGEKVSYEWREPWALASLSGPTRALFFEDERLRGEVTPPYRHYVWNKLLTFSTVDDVAAYIEANTSPEETITGASTLAPLVALYAHRRLAGDEGDTNSKRFSSGTLTDEAFWKRVCGDGLRYVVAAPRSRFDDRYMASNPAVQKYFKLDREFSDPTLLHFRDHPISLYRRLDDVRAPDGSLCAAQ